MGSSPRVRGSRNFRHKAFAALGIIPAGAGLTYLLRRTNCIQRDHPRGCGAHLLRSLICFCAWGSSPRVRGSLLTLLAFRLAVWIIPAGARLTEEGQGRARQARDHPRGCGAHRRGLTGVLLRSGSSPRVRGSRAATKRAEPAQGIIPAGAGLTRRNRLPSVM